MAVVGDCLSELRVGRALKILQKKGAVKLTTPKQAEILVVVRTNAPFKFKGKLIYNVDDVFWAMPTNHACYDGFANMLKHNYADYWLEKANLVMSSCNGASEWLLEHKQKLSLVMPNVMPKEEFLPSFFKFKFNGSLVFSFGNFAHDHDIIGSGLGVELVKMVDAYSIKAYGNSNLKAVNSLLHPSFISFLPMGEAYTSDLKYHTGAVGLIPLVDDAFNSGKSAIKGIEFVTRGIMPVFSFCGEYKEWAKVFPWMVKQGSWMESIDRVKAHADDFPAVNAWVKERYNLDRVVDLWGGALKSLGLGVN